MSIKRKYMKLCKKKNENMGFKCSGDVWFRIKGNMLQSFEFDDMRRGRECRINFGLVPLCNKVMYPKQGCRYDLIKFEQTDNITGKENAFTYNNLSISSADDCLEKIFHIIDTYLMPIFEKTESSNEAFNMLTEILVMFEESRLNKLKLRGIADGAEPLSRRMCFDTNLLYFALKSKEYDFAIRALRENVAKDERALSEIEGTDWEIPLSLQYALERKILLEHLEKADYDAVQAILTENENYSMRMLEKYV